MGAQTGWTGGQFSWELDYDYLCRIYIYHIVVTKKRLFVRSIYVGIVYIVVTKTICFLSPNEVKNKKMFFFSSPYESFGCRCCCYVGGLSEFHDPTLFRSFFFFSCLLLPFFSPCSPVLLVPAAGQSGRSRTWPSNERQHHRSAL